MAWFDGRMYVKRCSIKYIDAFVKNMKGSEYELQGIW